MKRQLQRCGMAALAALSMFAVSTASAAVKAEGLTPLRGAAVRPRIVAFGALPRITTPYAGPILERPEAINPEADAQLEFLKQHPVDIRPGQLTQLTLDTNAGGNQVLAPTVGNGFEGIMQGSYIPGEPTVAGGPLNIFTTGNVSVTVTNKDGSTRVETDGRTFYGVSAGEGAISDPQCYYDALRGRFVALAFTQGTSPSNYSNFYLVISQTNDARGLWYSYKFDMTKDGNLSTSNWGDYEALGVSDDKIAFSSQQFRFADNTYAYQKIRIIDRALAYSGGPVPYLDFTQFNAPSGQNQDVFVTKVARNLSFGDNTIHCLCVRTNGGTNVTYRTVTGPPGAPVLSAGSIVGVSPYGAPPDAVQKGSATAVPTNDCRPTDFYVRNGVLIAAWHTGTTIGGGSVCAVRMMQLRTSDLAVLTDETYGAAATFMYYPAVTVDSVGTIFLGFDRSSATEYPSAYATGKRRGDASLQPSALLKAGLAANAQSRWGDYTGIDNDASLSGPGGSTAWYAGQYTKNAFSFGAWINRLTFTYAQITGSVTDDCDGVLGTSGDRGPAAGVTLTLMQGVTTLATTQTDAAGNYSFGYLESGTYDVVVTPPGGSALDAVAGTGGTTQTRIGAGDLQVNLTNAQTSIANLFLVSSTHPAPLTSSLSPPSRIVGSGAFPLTVNGSNFIRCSTVQFDGANRATTYVSAVQLTAAIPASDVAGPGIHAITVATTGPGGGTSNSQTFTVPTGTDHTAPVVTVSSPTGGESWPVASLHNLTWTASDNVAVANVDLDYSIDGGATFPFTIAHAIPNSGVYAWTVAGTPSTTARVRVTARDADGNVAADSSHANFTISGWTITASAGANGSISPSGAVGVADGATPTFTITPNTGYSVANVLVNGGSVGAVTQYTFAAVHANQAISASFTINQYTLSVAVLGNGSVARSPDQPLYDHGTQVTLTANPSPGSSFQSWSGDASGSVNPLLLTMTGNRNITATFYQHIYTWIATGTSGFATAANWSPPRVAPAADDVLLFSGGGAVVVTGVLTQTLGGLAVSNATSISLQASSSVTLTIAGGPGPDLTVQSGSALRLTGASAITVTMSPGATASIAGTLDVLGGPHRFLPHVRNATAIEFQAGSVVTMGASFSGNLFGTGPGPDSSFNSVVFHNGSLCSQSAGATPFGAAVPNAVVVFEPGSRFRLDNGSVTPSFAGRTYADFEQNNTSSITPTGGSAFTLDSLIVSRGSLNLSVNPGGTIRGSIVVKSGATLQLNPLSASAFTLGGGTTQAISIVGNFSTTAFANLVINNPSGILLASNLTLNGGLTFTTGRVVTGANVLAVSGGAITGASQAAGYVDGSLRLNFAAGATSGGTFDIGDEASYTPVTVDMADVATPFDLTAAVHPTEHPNIGTSGLDAARSVNRYWTLSVASAPAYSSFGATFNYRPSNMDAAAVPSVFQVKRWNGSWSSTTIGTRTATSTQATALTDFGDFIVADPPGYTLAIATVGSGSVAKSPDLALYSPGSIVQLTATGSGGSSFVGWSGDLTGSANPVNVTMNSNKSITAAFADSANPSITLLSPNGSESYLAGSTANVTWVANGGLPWSGVDILLSRTGLAGPFDPIALSVPNTGSYAWIVGGPANSAAVVEVVARKAGGASGSDVSDATFTITTAVTGTESGTVTEFALSPVLPNPVRDGALLRFALPRAAAVRLSVVDLQGRQVAMVAAGAMAAGRHEARLAAGPRGLPPGLYLAHLQVEGRTFVRRFVITR